MTTDKHNKRPNVPPLRFPEFTEPWETAKLGDMTVNFSKRNKDEIEYPMYSVTNNRGFIPQSEQFEDREMVSSDIKSYKIITKGDFAYNPARINVGSIAKYNGDNDCMISSLYVAFRAKEQINAEWLMQLLKTPKMNFYYNLNAEGGVRMYLFYPNFERIRTSYPSLNEQRKVAQFLDLLDHRIAVQSGLIEDLKNIKKYLMEQLFCQPKEKSPRLRLGGMSDEWKKVRLCDVVERVTTRNKTNECTRVLTIAAQYGLIDQQEFFNKQIASSDLTTYYLLHRGDFAYNKSYSSDYPWGAVKRLDNYEEGVLSSLYICFCPNKNIDSDFLRHYFESTKWYRGISEISGEGARNHGLLNMSVEDFFNTTHRIPSIEEQRCISHLLNAFAHKIINEESILDKLRRQKSYLLNNMFI